MPNLVTIRNYADGQILFKVHLDQFLDSIEDWANNVKLDSVNIQNGGISTDNLADLSVTSAKLNTSSVTLPKLGSDVSERLMPAGSIQAYAGSSAPSGWLLCDGSQVSRTVFSALFAVVGESFGEGDNATTFHLPDLRGRFLRGRDAGASRDPDAAGRTAMNSGGATGDNVGSVQDQAVQPLAPSRAGTGVGGDGNKFFGGADVNSWADAVNGGQYMSAATGTLHPSTNLVKARTGSNNETRPLNANVNYIIKT